MHQKGKQGTCAKNIKILIIRYRLMVEVSTSKSKPVGEKIRTILYRAVSIDWSTM